MRCPTWRNIVYDSESGGRVRVGRGWGVGRVRARTVTYKNNNCHYRNVGRGSGVPRRRPRFPFAGTYCGLIKKFARIRVVDSSTRETCTSLQTTLFFKHSGIDAEIFRLSEKENGVNWRRACDKIPRDHWSPPYQYMLSQKGGGRLRVWGWGVGRVRARTCRTVTYKNNNCHHRNVGRGNRIPRPQSQVHTAGTWKSFARAKGSELIKVGGSSIRTIRMLLTPLLNTRGWTEDGGHLCGRKMVATYVRERFASA